VRKRVVRRLTSGVLTNTVVKVVCVLLYSAVATYYGRTAYCVADADIIFSSCGFFYLLLLTSSFFLAYSQPSQIGCLPYVYHMSHQGHTWCGLGANLECRSEMCCMRLAENTGRKNGQKFAICMAPSHNFVGLYPSN